MSTVVRLDTTLVNIPFAKPLGTAIHAMTSAGCVLVEIETDDGVVGQGYVFVINGDRLAAFDETIRGFRPFVVGRSVHETEGIWHSIWRAINPTGHKGITISALSAIDVACWDAASKLAGLPLYRMFGACREEIDTYASSGLWLTASVEELVTEAQAYLNQGFTAIKLRIGSDSPDTDVARVRAVREAVGDQISLLVDANQRFTTKEAIRLGRRLEEFGLGWIEEPVAAGDLAGQARVTAALDTPVASGETEYTRFGMQAMIDATSADILMPDLQRMGGYSEFRKAAAAAAANHVPVSSHFFTEHSLSLAGSLDSCISVEHIDWFAPLFNEDIELRAGKLQMPDRPGTGFTINPSAAAHFAAS